MILWLLTKKYPRDPVAANEEVPTDPVAANEEVSTDPVVVENVSVEPPVGMGVTHGRSGM